MVEINEEHLLKIEVLTMNKHVFPQLRQFSEHELSVRKLNMVIGWADFGSTWVILEMDGFVGRARATDYVVVLVESKLWKDAVVTQVMDKYPQIFIK